MKGLDLKGALKSPVPFVLNNSHVDVRSVSCFYCPLEYFSTRQQRCRNWNYRAEVTALPTKLTTVICEEITDSMSAAFSSFSSSYIPSSPSPISSPFSRLAFICRLLSPSSPCPSSSSSSSCLNYLDLHSPLPVTPGSDLPPFIPHSSSHVTLSFCFINPSLSSLKKNKTATTKRNIYSADSAMTKEITTQGGLPLQAHLAHLSIITTKRKELRQHIQALISPPPPSVCPL